MQLFLCSIQLNSNFEPSFVKIHQVLREIWIFEFNCIEHKNSCILLINLVNFKLCLIIFVYVFETPGTKAKQYTELKFGKWGTFNWLFSYKNQN